MEGTENAQNLKNISRGGAHSLDRGSGGGRKLAVLQKRRGAERQLAADRRRSVLVQRRGRMERPGAARHIVVALGLRRYDILRHERRRDVRIQPQDGRRALEVRHGELDIDGPGRLRRTGFRHELRQQALLRRRADRRPAVAVHDLEQRAELARAAGAASYISAPTTVMFTP